MKIKISLLIGIATPLLLTLGSIWKIQEDDIFWQLKAGNEILSTKSIQTIESWSHTIRGAEWVNYQWLSEILFSVCFRYFGFTGLGLLRAVATALLFFSLSRVVLNLSKHTSILILLLPWVYSVIQYRLQLRPDFFCLLIFAIQVQILFSHLSLKKKSLGQWICVFFAAQFHAGSDILNLFLALLGQLQLLFSLKKSNIHQSRDVRNFIFITLLSFFATPIHFKILGKLSEHWNYDASQFQNSEWLPLNWDMFNVQKEGLVFIAWIGLLIAALTLYFRSRTHLKQQLNSFGLTEWGLWLGAFAFSLFAYRANRGIPFQVLFLFPYLVISLSYCLKEWEKSQLRRQVIVGIIFLSFGVAAYQIHRHFKKWGFGISESDYPLSAVQLIQSYQFKPEIFSSMGAGTYLVWALSDYRAFVDSRDVIYNSLKPQIKKAYQNPSEMLAFLNRWNVNIIVDAIPRAVFDPVGMPHRRIGDLFDQKEFALIDFDNRYFLAVRRIPEHQKAIEKLEYTLLDPSVPSTYSIKWFQLANQRGDDISKARFQKEIRQCLSQTQIISFCSEVSEKLNFLGRTPEP